MVGKVASEYDKPEDLKERARYARKSRGKRRAFCLTVACGMLFVQLSNGLVKFGCCLRIEGLSHRYFP
jgi:hypothetical protein